MLKFEVHDDQTRERLLMWGLLLLVTIITVAIEVGGNEMVGTSMLGVVYQRG